MSTSWQAKDITLNGNAIHLRHIGTTGPVLFLIHGFTDSSLSWTRFGESLADQFRVYAPDMVGHGRSMPLPGITSVASFIDDVCALIEHLELDEAAFCGHSMGGVIAAGVAARLGERATALVVEDPAWLLVDVPEPEFLGNYDRVAEWKEMVQSLRRSSWQEAIDSVTGDTIGWHPVDREVYVRDRLDFDFAIFSQLDFSVRNQWRDHLLANVAPLLLVTGDPEEGGIVGDAFAAEIFKVNGGGQRLHIPDAGHGIHRESFAAFAQGVRAFLEVALLA